MSCCCQLKATIDIRSSVTDRPTITELFAQGKVLNIDVLYFPHSFDTRVSHGQGHQYVGTSVADIPSITKLSVAPLLKIQTTQALHS